MWPCNWTDDLEKQWGSCAKHHQALCIISSSYVNSNCSYGSEMAKFWPLWPWPLTFDLWPLTFAWTSLLSMWITPENFMMIRWWKHSGKVWQTDGRTDRQTDWTIHRAAWSQLTSKINRFFENHIQCVNRQLACNSFIKEHRNSSQKQKCYQHHTSIINILQKMHHLYKIWIIMEASEMSPSSLVIKPE